MPSPLNHTDPLNFIAPAVTVEMITYNHAQYIAEAIESVLCQETLFPWEFLIVDDCSTDGTSDICKHYADLYPERIRFVPNEKNLGVIANSFKAFSLSRGKYVAWLEGDDYWIDSKKLAFQFDLLESKPDITMSTTRAQIIYASGQSAHLSLANYDSPQIFDLQTLMEGRLFYGSHSFPACTMFFRRQLTESLPDWSRSVLQLDYAVLVLSAEHGKIAYDPRITATYRIHPGGVWSGGQGTSSRIKKHYLSLAFISAIDRHFQSRYWYYLRDIISKTSYKLAGEYLRQNCLMKCRAALVFALRAKWFPRDLPLSEVVRLHIAAWFPGLCLIRKLLRKQLGI